MNEEKYMNKTEEFFEEGYIDDESLFEFLHGGDSPPAPEPEMEEVPDAAFADTPHTTEDVTEEEQIPEDDSEPESEAETEQGTEEPDDLTPEEIGTYDAQGKYQTMLRELNNLFSTVNRVVFKDEIKKTIVTISSSKHGPEMLCWCSATSVWKKKTDETPKFFEITYLAAGLDRPLSELACDALHQCIHVLNAQRGIKDFSRNGTYHNKRFKLLCEEVGMDALTEESGRYGYSVLDVPDSILNAIMESVNQDAFELSRPDPPEMPKAPRKKKEPSPARAFIDEFREAVKNLGGEDELQTADIAMLAAKVAKSSINGLKKQELDRSVSSPVAEYLEAEFDRRQAEDEELRNAADEFWGRVVFPTAKQPDDSSITEQDVVFEPQETSAPDDSCEAELKMQLVPDEDGFEDYGYHEELSKALHEHKCPGCGLTVYSYDEGLNIICSRCNVAFELQGETYLT